VELGATARNEEQASGGGYCQLKEVHKGAPLQLENLEDVSFLEGLWRRLENPRSGKKRKITLPSWNNV